MRNRSAGADRGERFPRAPRDLGRQATVFLLAAVSTVSKVAVKLMAFLTCIIPGDAVEPLSDAGQRVAITGGAAALRDALTCRGPAQASIRRASSAAFFIQAPSFLVKNGNEAVPTSTVASAPSLIAKPTTTLTSLRTSRPGAC